MTLEYVPLLKVQRDLYDLPRGIERFREYIQTMTGGGDELKLPLVAMNPMGKDHLPPFLDRRLLASRKMTLHTRARCCASNMSATDHATLIAALFGDAAARELGYQPLGLSPRAGLVLAAAGL